jgi:MFS family permease
MLWYSPNIRCAVVSRVIQGISCAMVWVTTPTILADTVGSKQIGQYMGFLAMAMNLGAVFGPLLGGVVFSRFGYNAVFAMPVVLVGVDILLRCLMLEARRPDTPAIEITFDLEGDSRALLRDLLRPSQRSSTGSSLSPLLRHSLAPSLAPSFTASLASAIPPPPEVEAEKQCLQVSVRETPTPDTRPATPSDRLGNAQAVSTNLDRRSRVPAVLKLLLSPRFLVALWGVAIQAVIGDIFNVALPLYGQKTFDWTSSNAGIAFLPLALPALLSPGFGALVDRFGPRWLAVFGFTIMTPCLVLLRLVTTKSHAQLTLLYTLLTLVGLCITIALEPLMAEITYTVEAEADAEAERSGVRSKSAYAQAYGLFNAAWSLGNTLGPITTGFVMQRSGWAAMTLGAGVLCAITVVPTLLLCGGWLFARR